MMSTKHISDEQREHQTIIRFLFYRGYIVRDNENGLKVTEKGKQRVMQAFNESSLEDIALILIMFCNDEGIKYTEYGVAK